MKPQTQNTSPQSTRRTQRRTIKIEPGENAKSAGGPREPSWVKRSCSRSSSGAPVLFKLVKSDQEEENPPVQRHHCGEICFACSARRTSTGEASRKQKEDKEGKAQSHSVEADV